MRFQPMGASRPGGKPIFFIPDKASRFWRVRTSRAISDCCTRQEQGSKLRAPLWIAELDWEALREAFAAGH